MAYVQTRQVSAGDLISGTFRELGAIKREVAIYFGAFFAFGLISNFLGFVGGLLGLLGIPSYFIAQFWLYRVALGHSDLGPNSAGRIVAMFFMALLLGLGIYFGFSIFFVPGILLGAKWIMAPTFLVAEEGDLFSAIGASWQASGNNLLSLSLAYTAIWAIWIGLIVIITAITGGIDTIFAAASGGMVSAFGLAGAAVGSVFHILPVLLLGLSVAAYKALADNDEGLIAVFE